jgi:hypothetical protein
LKTIQIKKASGKEALVKPQQLNSKSKLKQIIILLACWNIVPMFLADWLIKVWGLKHE